MSTAGPANRRADAPEGIAAAAAAYALWGLFPIYFKAVASVSALEVLAHRIVWSLLLLAAITAVLGKSGEVVAALRPGRLLATLALSATLLAVNWGVFIWAVAAGRVLDSSLGYFTGPLVSVALGVVVLGERLRPAQWVAVSLASLGVAAGAVASGSFPWVALVLATSFAAYGFLRKVVSIEPVGGLLVEALLLAPPALAWLALLAAEGRAAFPGGGWRIDVLLVLAGPVTTLPLILFVAGSRRIRLATLGLLQYITPSGQFLVAIALFGESLSPPRFGTFACVWLALAVYTIDLVRAAR